MPVDRRQMTEKKSNGVKTITKGISKNKEAA
jgi:hypothetical protein